MAKVTKIVKSPKANLKSLNDVEPQPKRSDTVEGLLEKVVKEVSMVLSSTSNLGV